MKSLIKRVKKWVGKQVKKLFSALFSKNKSSQYVQPVLHAAEGNAYIETYSNKADALHKTIDKSYEEDIQKEFLVLMNRFAPFFRRGKVRLGIDFHEIGYYGKEKGSFIVGTDYGNKSYKKAFKYMSISLLTGKKEERIHLYALLWHVGQDLVETVADLLKAVKPWFKKIEVVQFDRGFYVKELIHYMTEQKIPYLIHVPKLKGKITKLVGSTKSFYKGTYKKKFSKDKSTHWMSTNLYICKDVKNHNWIFASSINFTNKYQPVKLYRNRWQIETNYAINNQNRIMSKSTKYLTRYFYFLLDILIQILWRISNNCHLTFKFFLMLLIAEIRQLLDMKPTILKPPPKT